MKKIIITGAGGQLGKAFREVLPDAEFVDLDRLDFTATVEEIKQKVLALAPEVFINCGAYTNVDGAEINIDLANKINGDAVRGISEACQELNTQLIQISTDYVLGDSELELRDETEKTNPHSVYGSSKLAGEIEALKNPNTTIVRTSWLFGEGKNFINTMLELSKTKSEIDVVDDQMGRPTFALDLAEMINKLLELESLPKIIHIQNEGPSVSWAGFAKKIFELADKDTKVNGISTEQYIKQFSSPEKKIAWRPKNSVFSMRVLHSLDLEMRKWEEAVEEYLERNVPNNR